jgi:uncharacterized protein YfiM (DUF2279 family)
MTATILLALTLSANPPAPWFGEDKIRHFLTSFVATSMAASVARFAGLETRQSMIVGGAIGTGVGIWKELYDVRRGGRVSGGDLVWNLAGVGTATLIQDATR